MRTASIISVVVSWIWAPTIFNPFLTNYSIWEDIPKMRKWIENDIPKLKLTMEEKVPIIHAMP